MSCGLVVQLCAVALPAVGKMSSTWRHVVEGKADVFSLMFAVLFAFLCLGLRRKGVWFTLKLCVGIVPILLVPDLTLPLNLHGR